MNYQPRDPQPFQDNPFGFVYGDALTANVEGAVNVHPISYDAAGVTVAANVYTPAATARTARTRVLWWVIPMARSRSRQPACMRSVWRRQAS